MRYTGLLVALFLVLPISNAQQPAMSANTGLGPGNSFTLFITFQSPMPNIQTITCAFRHEGAFKQGQEDFTKQLSCTGAPVRDDDTHYRTKVDIPQDIAAGEYKIDWINVSENSVGHGYSGPQLPDLGPVTVINPKHLEFSPIKKLEIKQ